MELSSDGLTEFFATTLSHLNERQRRLVVGAMAEALGRGGQARVVSASAMSSSTVAKAAAEVRSGTVPSVRQRAPGGGDKPAIDKQPGLLEALDELVHPDARDASTALLRWTLKPTSEIAGELQRRGFHASAELVRRLLHQMGYGLQAPAKRNAAASHPDRDGQLAYLNDLAARFVGAGEPVISVDTKKREPAGKQAKAIPGGGFDITDDEGWISAGDTADTAEPAVESIRRWWTTLGKARFADTTRLLITADAGHPNGDRVRTWQWHLAKLAGDTGLELVVCHHPSTTSKWSKIEHRTFSLISMDLPDRPLTDVRTVVELIAAATTNTGLIVQAAYDPSWCPTGVKITDRDHAVIPLTPHEWHGEWNYTINPA